MKTMYTEEQKHELVKRYYDGESVSSVDDYIDRYNNERPHSALQYMTPNAFEEAFYRKNSEE